MNYRSLPPEIHKHGDVCQKIERKYQPITARLCVCVSCQRRMSADGLSNTKRFLDRFAGYNNFDIRLCSNNNKFAKRCYA